MVHTRKVPRLAFVEAHFSNRVHCEAAVDHLLGQVVAHQLLISGVEPKPRRQPTRIQIPSLMNIWWSHPTNTQSHSLDTTYLYDTQPPNDLIHYTHCAQKPKSSPSVSRSTKTSSDPTYTVWSKMLHLVCQDQEEVHFGAINPTYLHTTKKIHPVCQGSSRLRCQKAWITLVEGEDQPEEQPNLDCQKLSLCILRRSRLQPDAI